MSELAVAISMFSRVNRLEEVFQSIEGSDIGKVYVADNGKMTDEKRSLYNRDYCFDLAVFDLEYDSGLGNCRKVLTEEIQEDIFVLLDSDIHLPNNYEILVEQLKANPEIGAISGLLLEENRIYTTSGDLREEDDVIYKYVPKNRTIDYIAEAPFIKFDFIPNAGVFRKECVEDYTWDAQYRGGEHVDFYVGHKRNTNWVFGTNPQVIFPHFPGGSQKYQSSREAQQKRSENRQYFYQKWGVTDLQASTKTYMDTYPHYRNQNKIDRLREIYEEEGFATALDSTTQYIIRNALSLLSK